MRASTVGSELRITPSVLSPRPHPQRYANTLRVLGVSGVTAVVSKLDNSVPHRPSRPGSPDADRYRTDELERVGALVDAFFVRRTAASAMAALRAVTCCVLVDTQAADELGCRAGRRGAGRRRGTKQQVLETMHVIGLFKRSRLSGGHEPGREPRLLRAADRPEGHRLLPRERQGRQRRGNRGTSPHCGPDRAGRSRSTSSRR